MFKLTSASLANRAVVGLLTVLIAAAGVFSLASLKQELFPDFSAPQTTVLTTAPGTSPEVVDQQITVPLARVLGQVDGVESVTSTSSSGVSAISLTTDFGLDEDKLTADVQEAVDSVAPQLPSGAKPQVTSGSLADLPAMTLTVSSDAPASELSDRLTNVAVPELRGIDGVRDVTVSGGTTKRVTVAPDAAALRARGLSTESISQALSANGSAMPVGSIVQDGGIVAVQVGSELTSIQDIENLPLTSAAAPGRSAPDQTAPGAGGVVTIGDVAKVSVEPNPVTSLTRVDGEPAVSVQITATADADLVSLSDDVNAELGSLETAIGGNAKFVVAGDQAPFISESIRHLAIEGGLGLLFAVLVILVFLRSARPTIVTAISIPLSIFTAFIGLYLRGYSLNIFTLGALTIAIGRVVDDSIVVIENIKRHLGYGESKLVAIRNGTREVSAAITASTIATVLVFVPIAIVGGFVGQLFRPFALTVAIAMLSSLAVALTIVPVLSYWFLSTPTTVPDPTSSADDVDGAPGVVPDELDHEEEPNLLQRYYLPMLRWTMRKPVAVILAAVVLLGGSLALIPRLGVEFLGDTGADSISVSQTFDSSLTIGEVTEQVAETEKLMLGVDGVENVIVTASLAGGGTSGATAGPPGMGASGDTTATYTVSTDADVDVTSVQDRLEDAVKALPNPDSVTVDAGSTGIGSSTVDVEITGTDEQTLRTAADQVTKALAGVPQATDLSNDLAADQPTLRVTVDRGKAAAYGLTEQAIAGAVSAAMTPRSVSKVSIDGQQLAVYLGGDTVTSRQDLTTLPLVAGVPGSPGAVTVGDVAAVDEVSGPSSVGRSGVDLVATVSLTPADGELGTVQTEVEKRLDALDLPDGVEVGIGGVSEQQSEAFGQLGLAMLVAVGLIFVLLVAVLRSLVQPFILMLSIPFAAIGSLGLLYLTGTALGVAALIGMLMLIGIVVTNAIVLMDLINQYRHRGLSVADAITKGAGRRVRPVVMTALATIFALMPMAIGVTGGSGFISKALAIVVIGGLISSTALTLLLVPAVYQIIEGRRERRATRRRQAGTPAEAARTTAADGTVAVAGPR
ncbi:efflux RND transporter permease subunit [Skermania piniformis]|uniref:Efflux RND transporter permease subunit n=1 Tax=Skermania pinensis TaxID=39122 RepID=A0ABX8S6V5_9ACTN|nr:efflux RND transporter permease subunit [Skermania piniformis]QXQ13196.1 efflux RND transporter permease subunit [Skermania piniformis]